MELTRLKGKLRTAQRGHKLLKDKRDELMKQFLDTVREVRALRQEVEEELMTVHGAFTVACNATPWNCRFPSVTDLVLSPDGKHAAALGSQNNSRFQIAVDGKVWDGAFDMAWPVVFSPAGDRAAAKVRRNGKFALYVDGSAVIENLDGVWNPTFSPDGTVLLFCSLKDGVFSRHTVRL